MGDSGSITRCIMLLKQGDPDAAQVIWDRYFHRLTSLARSRLRATLTRSADSEDVALSAIDSFFRRARDGRFPQLEDRSDLWQLLFVLTVRKAANLSRDERRQSRGGGRVLVLSDLEGEGSADVIAGDEPSPELAAEFADQVRYLMDRLGDEILRAVALGKLEGYTNLEIARKLGCVEHTVERKLRAIRRLWSEEVPDERPAGDD
jgi:DNA-directed RNA polymerase specialized sigma24 family protein